MRLFKKIQNEKLEKQMAKRKLLSKFKILTLTILVLLVLLIVSFKSNVANETISTLRRKILNSQGIYTVSFYDSNGIKLWQTEVSEGYTFVEEGENSEEKKTFIYEGPEVPERNSYKFSGWLSSTGSNVINQDTDFTALYLEDTKYIFTVRYIKQNGEVAANTYVQLIQFGEPFSVISPEVEGYTTETEKVEGTITEEIFEELEKNELVEVQWDEKKTTCTIIVTITYLPEESSYEIIHYKQDINGVQYEEAERETVTGVRVGDIITNVGKEKTYTGFTLNERLSTFDGTVAVGGKTEMKLYYDRDVYYNYYDTADGEYIEVSPILYGANPNVLTTTPIREGYSFTGWKYYKENEENEENDERIEISLPETMETYDIIWVAQWETAENRYSITYWKENANDDEFTNIGTKTIEDGFKTGDRVNVYDELETIKNGFNELSGEGQREYFTYDEEETRNRNSNIDIENILIKADGSTNVNIYYRRNVYKLRFYAGRYSNRSNQIASNTNGSESACSWVNTSTAATININGEQYENNEYVIEAKFEQDISNLWPTADTIDDVRATNDTTYHFISWGTSSDSPYWKNPNHTNKNILGNYSTMASELIINPEDPSEEHELFGYWATGQRFYKYHYMLENIDPTSTSGTRYENKYYTEANTAIVKSTNTKQNQNAADIFGYDLKGKDYEGSGTESGGNDRDSAVDIYFFYERHTFTITIYNVNTEYIPSELSEEVIKNGVSKDGDRLVAKYGANLAPLQNEYLKWIEDESNPFKNPLVTTGLKAWELEGFYRDRSCTNIFNWSSPTLTRVSENRVIYVKWKAPTYKISFDVNSGNWNDLDEKYSLEDNLYVEEEEEGDSLTEPIEPTREGYVFDGWYYNQRINGRDYEVKYLFSESQVIYNDVKLTAKWIRVLRASYKVRYIEAEYDETGKLIEDIKLYKTIKPLAQDKDVDDILIGTIVTEQAIMIESTDGLYVVRNREKSITINNNNIEDNTIYFFYTKLSSVKYTIYYVQDTGRIYQNGEIPEEEYWLEQPTRGTISDEEHILFQATSAYIRGYVPDAFTKTLLLVSDEENNIIIFYYNENEEHGNYTINYFFMQEDGTYPSVPDEKVTGEKGVGSIIYASQYEEYLETEKYIGHTLDYEKSDSSGVITSTDETTIINLYFKNDTYTVTYHTQGGEWLNQELNYQIAGKDTYELQVTYPESAPEVEVQRNNYKFLGWYELYNLNNKNYIDLTEFNFDEPITKNTELYAVWSETKDLTITKIWEDDNDRDGLRPENISINLLRDEDNVATIKLENKNGQQSNTWQTEINIDKYDYSEYVKVLVYEENGTKKIKLNGIDEETEIAEIIPVPASSLLSDDADLDVVLPEPTFTMEEKEVSGYESNYDNNTFTITNSHDVAKVSRKVTKSWNDDDDRDRQRPQNVTVKLLKNGTQYEDEIVLSDENGWTYEWPDLYYNENGTPIEYTLQENPVVGYRPTISMTNENTFSVINTHNPETIHISVEKEWVDNKDQDGKRPNNVTVKILADGCVLDGSETELSDANGWKFDYELYKFDEGNVINYEVQEDVPDFYEASYQNEGDSENRKVIITNTHNIEKVNKTIKKEWNDKENQDGLRPEELYVKVYKNGQQFQEVKLNDSNNWQFELQNLNVYENKQKLNYTVEEVNVPSGYNEEYDQENTTITNTHEVAKTSRTVKVEWVDKEDQDGLRPTQVSVKLYANGIEKETVTLTEEQGWTYEWDDLDLNQDGEEITYTIEQVDNLNPNYTTETDNETFIITNTHNIEKVSKTVNLIWEDNENQDGYRPEDVRIILYKNGEEFDRVTISKGEAQTYTWDNLDKNSGGEEIRYTVQLSEEIPEYQTEYSGDTFTITNKHTPETTSKTVTKIWRDSDDKDQLRPDSVNLQLYGDGEKVRGEITLSDANKSQDNDNYWVYTYEDLPVYKDGNKITYTINEPVVPESYGVLYDQEKLIVYNAFPPEVDVSVTKVWNDGDNADNLRPENIKVQLKADGENYTVGDNNIGLVELNEDNNWTYKWSFIEKYNSQTNEKYNYTIEELGSDSIEGYTTYYPTVDERNEESIYEFQIVNTHEPEKVTRKVTKVWNDSEDNDKKRPEEIHVNLLADGVFKETVTLNNENNFSYEWTLNKNKLGTEVNYTVEEVVPDGYRENITYNDADKTFTITNTHDIETISRNIQVVWEDKNDQDGYRPEQVKVQLQNNKGLETKEIILNELNNWSYPLDGLQRYLDGEEIIYSVKETNVDDLTEYTIDYSTSDNDTKFVITNTHIPETISKTVTKVWEDNNNQDVLRPHSIQVKLKATNKDFEDTVTLNENNWSYTWENLDKNVDGNEINYQVEEVGNVDYYVENYETNEDGNFIIKNVHIPNTVKRKIIVNWNDKNDQDGIRPEEVFVQLKADGDNYREPIRITNETGWEILLDDLPERKPIIEDDTTIIHFIAYSAEENVPAEYSAEVEIDENNNIIITNTHIVATTYISVEKQWNDKNDQDRIRPNSVVVQLKANGTNVRDAISLSDDNSWTYTWQGLDKNNEGEEIDYTVEEINANEKYSSSTTFDEENRKYVITNSYNPQTVSRTVIKEWNDNTDQDGFRPSQVKIQLKANGENKGQEVTLNDDNGWTYTWEELDKNNQGREIQYSVEEINPDSNYNSSTVYNKQENTFTITNTHTPEKVNKTVTKVWDDSNDQDRKRPGEVKVQLIANNNNKGPKIILNAENGWTYTWTNLDKYENGDLIQYEVEEEEIPNYSTKYSYEDATGIFTITNSYPAEKTEKTVRKVWNDKNNQDGIRPEEIFVQLKGNNINKGDPVSLNAGNNWTYTWEGLDKNYEGEQIRYSVDEISVNNYTTEINQVNNLFIITNSYTPEVISKNVKVVWEDSGNEDEERPSQVTVKLKADGIEDTERIFNNENDWTNSWTDIDKCANGSEINYYFEAEDIPDYTKEITYNEEEDTYIVTYSHKLETIEKTVEIVWVDNENKNSTRPESVKVQLYANGEPFGEIVTLSQDDDWKHTFNLHKKIDGKDAVYTVEQVDAIENYYTSYSEDTFIITNTLKSYNYSVEYYYDGIREDSATLYYEAKAGDIITSYPSKLKDNYEFFEDNLPLIISAHPEDNVIRVYYERKDVKATIKYLDKYTEKAVSNEITVTAKMGDSFNLDEYSKNIVDYTLIQEPEIKEGTYTNEEYEFIFYYAKNSNVIVKYLEKGTNQTLAKQLEIHGYQGKSYRTDSKEIEGYTYLESTNNTTGVHQRNDIEVIYYYAKNTKVIVKCVDRSTLETIDSYEIPGYEGKEYNIEPKEITGYTYISKTNNSTGKMTQVPQEVTLYYAKNTRVIVKYLEKNSEIQLDQVIINGYEGMNYKTELKNITGYTFVESIGQIEGTMLRDEIVVKYYYLQNAKIIIQHIDKNTNTILKEEAKDGKVGDTIKTAPIDIPEYIFVEGPSNPNVVLTKDIQTIKYYYSHVSEGVLEKHIDIVTGEIIYSNKIEGVEGQLYNVNSRNFEGYDLVNEKLPNNNKGTMTRGLIEVDYYYIKKATVKVLYIDKLTNEEISEPVIINGHENDNYETSKKDIENYVFANSTENTKGQMKVSVNPDGTFNHETIVKYFYIKKSAGVLEQHIDFITEEVIETKTQSGKVGDNYVTYPIEIEGYDLVKEKVPTNANGQMKEELITVKYYYIRKTKVIVKHVDVRTHEELFEEIITGHEKDKYETMNKLIDGYDLSIVPTNANGEMTKEDIIVTFYYIKKAKVNIEYIDKETGEKIEKDDTINGHVGESYQTKPKDIMYYKFVESSNNESGKMKDDEIIVKYYYEKAPFDMMLKIKRVIINGNTSSSSHNVYKIEIPANRVKTSKQDITFIIKIENVGEVEGNIDEIRTKIPYGFEFNQEKNNIIWKFENNILSTTELKETTLKPGESKEIELTLTWNGEKGVLGQISNEIILYKSTNPAKYQETDYENNKSSVVTIFAIKTGQAEELAIDIMMTVLVIILPIGSYIIESKKKNKNKKFPIV